MPQRPRDLVDLALADPLQVRRAERAVAAGRRGVRVDAAGVHAERLPAIRARRGVASRRGDPRPVVGVGARVEPALDVAPEQATVARRAVRTRAFMPWRREVTIDSPTPFWIRTGRRALRASATAIGSIFVYDFEPKPPPRYGTITRTEESGRSNSAAISARTRNGCWQVAQSVISPRSTCAITVWVSIAYW